MISPTDRIEKKILLRAPQERVWRAISDAKQFGTWFGVEFEGDFARGQGPTRRWPSGLLVVTPQRTPQGRGWSWGGLETLCCYAASILGEAHL